MPSTFRYWGIAIRATANGLPPAAGNPAGLGNIEFATSLNGPNVAYGLATFTDGVYRNGGGQCQAFDGWFGNASHTVDGADHNLSISTNDGGSVPVRVWCDLGQPTTVVRCTVISYELAYAVGMVADYDVIGSNDAVNWTVVWTPPIKTGWDDLEPQVSFDPTYIKPSYTGTLWGPHQYWRVIWGRSSGVNLNVSLAEIQFRATKGGPSQQTGGAAIGYSPTYSGSSAAQAFDGDNTTFYASAGTNTYSGWVGYNHAAPVSVAEVSITARNDGSSAQAPRTCLVQWSDDSLKWTTAWGMNHTAVYQPGETLAVAEPVKRFPNPQIGRRVGHYRLYATQPAAAYSVRRLGDYEGPLLRVRTPSFDVVDIGADSQGNLDMNALLAVGVGNSVVRWYDQSGRGNHANALVGSAPTLVVANGRPQVYFASSTLDAYGYGFATGAFTAIGMVNLTSSRSWPMWIDNPMVSGGLSLGYTDVSLRLDLQYNGRGDISVGLTAPMNIPHIVSWTAPGGITQNNTLPSVTAYLNGTGASSIDGSGLSQPLQQLRIGRSYEYPDASSGDNMWGGYIGEILIWDSIIPDRAQVEQRVAQYFGVSAVPGYNTVDSGMLQLSRRIAS